MINKSMKWAIAIIPLIVITVPLISQAQKNNSSEELTSSAKMIVADHQDFLKGRGDRRPKKPKPSPSPSPEPSPSPTDLSTTVLADHNKYRTELGIPNLTWSDTLANDAQSWANYLALNNKFEHSGVSGQGENLWKGTAGYFTPTQMVDHWGSEKQYFQNGVFPNVSTTGNWFDVGHYTQMIWKNTTQVGCGIARGGGNDILVCRYAPPGNYTGQTVY